MRISELKIDLQEGTTYVWAKEIATRQEMELLCSMLRIAQRAVEQCREAREKYHEGLSRATEAPAGKDEAA
jgi:hypothetical protein